MATLPHRWSKTRLALAGCDGTQENRECVLFSSLAREAKRRPPQRRLKTLGCRPQEIFLQAELIISSDETVDALFCKFNYVISFDMRFRNYLLRLAK
jgi:hypothetical protein